MFKPLIKSRPDNGAGSTPISTSSVDLVGHRSMTLIILSLAKERAFHGRKRHNQRRKNTTGDARRDGISNTEYFFGIYKVIFTMISRRSAVWEQRLSSEVWLKRLRWKKSHLVCNDDRHVRATHHPHIHTHPHSSTLPSSLDFSFPGDASGGAGKGRQGQAKGQARTRPDWPVDALIATPVTPFAFI